MLQRGATDGVVVRARISVNGQTWERPEDMPPESSSPLATLAAAVAAAGLAWWLARQGVAAAATSA